MQNGLSAGDARRPGLLPRCKPLPAFKALAGGSAGTAMAIWFAAAALLVSPTDAAGQTPKPAAPTVTRTQFSVPTNPALDVTWTAPAAGGMTITGYKAQYRKKAAAGEDPADWTAYSGTLGATATTFNLPGVEAGATYEAQVRAVTSQEGDGPWSDTGTGRANRAPATTSVSFNGGTFPVGTIADYKETGQGALGVMFQDADGDALTYSAAAQHPALLGVSLTGAAGSAQLRVTLLNQGSSKVTYTARDAYGGSVTRTATIGITAKASRSIAEHSAAGTAVGAPVTGTPYNGVALTYSFTGKAKDSGLFVIESATGQIKVATGATLDYETDDSHRETETWNGQVIAKFYRGKVGYTVDGHAAAIDVIIKVTDVGAPKPAAPTVTRTQFGEPTSPALDVTWTAPVAGGLTITGYKAQYRKKAAAGADPAAWTAYSGTLGATATTFNLAGVEAGATYEAQVRAVTSQEGDGAWSDTGEGTANRAPGASSVSFSGGTLGVGGAFAWHETPPLGSGAFFSDADGDALTYAASAEKPALLGVSLSGAAGNAVLTANLLNQGTSKVTYTARDAYGGSVTRTTTIGITAKTNRSIAEHSAAGTAVGDPVTGTPYNGVALTYSLTGKAKDSDLFVIESATGQIKVATGATLDYETDDSHRETETFNGEVIAKFYRGKVNYTVDGHAAAIDVIIKVTNIGPGKPDAPMVTRTEFSEPTSPALDVTWTAPAAGGLTITGYKAQYRKKAAAGEDPAAWTAYSGTLGAAATTFNLAGVEAGATYEAQVHAVTSQEGDGPWSNTGEGMANRAPAASSISFSGGTLGVGGAFAWHEAPPLGSGAFFSDADGDALTYAASAEKPALLGVSLSGAPGSAVLTANLLNQGSSKVTFTARDAYGGSVTRTTTIGITAKTSRSIAEHSAAGTAVGAPVTGTPYNGAALTYSLTGKAKDSDLFVIESATGQIKVATGATLDYETDDAHRETETWNGQVIAKFYRGKVNYTVDGNAAVIDVNILVTDVGTPRPAAPTVTRAQFSDPTDPAMDVTWTAPAAGGMTITGYKAQYRKKAAAGEDPASWTAYSGTLGATATTFNLAGVEAGATYEAQVHAVTSQEGDGAWSDTGTGRANRAPGATGAPFNGGTFPVGTIADYKETGQGAFFSDADGDALTYSAAAQHPALLGVSLTGSAGSAQLRVTLLNQGSSKVTFTARDAYGGSVTRTATIGITAKTSRTIAENSAGGTAVGAPVTGTPYNGAALTYSLTSKAKDSGLFVIESSTGQIKVATGATLDYETDDAHRETETSNGQVIAKFYRGKVNYTVDGNAAVIDVNILVTDVGTPKPAAPTVTRAQFSDPTDPAMDVTWTAPAAGGMTITGYKAQYRKKAAAGEDPADWTAYSGTLGATATTFNLPGVEAGATYEAQVRAVTSQEGDGAWSDTGTGRANRAPAASSVSFNGGTFPVGTIADYKETGQGAFFSDADGDALTYSAAAQHPALLGVSLTGAAGSAQLRVTLLNQGSSKVTYTARDAYGGSVTRTATIGITAKTSRSIVEHSPAGTAVGAPVTGTPYNGAALTYSLTGNAKDSGLFVIESSTGQIKVATGATLDYDTDDTYRETETFNGEVTAKFYRGKVNYTVDGHAAAIDVIIKLTVNTPPVITDPGDTTLAQGEAIAALDITVTDADGDTPTVTVTGLPSGLSYASGRVSGTVADDATVQDYTVTITANDGVNADVTATFTITVTDESFPPVITDPGDKTVAQGAAITAFDITVTDPDGDTPTVTVTGLPSGLSYASGQVSGTVAQDAVAKDHTVTITANDGTHADVTATFTITVTDESFPPVITNPGDKTVAQGAAITAFDITVTDADGGTPTVTVTGLPSGLSYASGQVSGTVAKDAVAKDHTVTITANDGTHADVTATFTITVTDVSFAPVITDPGDKTVAQGAAITAFDITVTDADGGTPTVTVTGLPSGLSYASGQVSGTVANDAAVKDHTVTITANDGTHADVTETFTVTVTDVNFPPVITDPGSKSYKQGEAITAFAINVTDADGDTPTVTVTGMPSGLSYASGQVSGTVAQDAAVKDHTVTITANDATHADVTEKFTITVTDVNFAPVITDPGDKTVAQGASITAFGITVTDADGETPTVTVTGLPSGLSYASGQVSGTVAQDAAVKAHTVTISADDGTNDAVTETFTVTVTDVAFAPVITDPGDRTYAQGESITAFDITVTDADGDTPTVTVTGLPSGLSYASGQVSGTVAQDAVLKDYTVTITANDGTHADVTETFTITVSDESFAPVIADPGDKTVAQGASITAFDITVTDADGDTPTVTVTGLPTGLSYASGEVSGTAAQDAAVKDHTVTITANDGAHADVTETFTITVTDVAFAPVIADPGDKTVAQGAAITAFDITVTDADGDTPTVTVTGLPTGLSYASGEVSGTVAQDAAVKDHTVTITANDGTNDAVTETFTITVTDVNFAPVITDPGDKTYAQGAAITAFAITVTDADGDTPTVTVTGLPAGLSYASGEVSGTVAQDAAVQDHTVTINADDGTNADVTETFTITVTDVSFAPVIADPGDKTYAQGAAITAFAITVTDADGDTPTVTVTGLPTGLSYASGEVSGTVAQYAAVQDHTVTISADDGTNDAVTETFTVTVTDVNFPPAIADPGDRTYLQGESITAFAITVTDADGDTPTVAVTGLPTGLSYASGQVSGAVAADAALQDYTATVTADDGTNDAVTLTFTITVADESFAPVIADPGDKTYDQGEAITAFDITVTDADGDTPTVTVTGLPAGLSYASGEVSGTVARSAAVQDYTVTITANDGAHGDVTETFAITVTDVAFAPVIADPGDKTYEQGESITTFAITVTDADGDTPTVTVTGLPSGLSYASGQVSGTVAQDAAVQDHTVTISADDGTNDAVTETFTITVIENDRAPGTIGDSTTVYVSIHDPEGPVAEGTSVELPVTLSSSVGGTVEVPWTTSSSGPASRISVADRQSGHEHEPSSGTVTLAAGQTEAIIEIIILDDEEHEDLESFGIDLGEPSVASGASQKVVVGRRTATVTILDNDAPPVFDDGDAAIRTVAENTPPGTAIGTPVSATDAEDDPLSYTLGGTDASVFSMDSATGQLSTKDSLDFEVKSVYDGLTVTVDDGHGHTDVLSLTVNVTDVSPPDAPDAPSVGRSSGDPAGSLDVSWTAPADNGGPIVDYDVRYREAGTTAWRDHAFNGTGASTTIAGLKAATTYEVQVMARNAEGDGAWSDSGRGTTHDPSTVRETVTMADAAAPEGGVLTFAVRLNRTVPGGLTVTPVIRGGTATRGRDYTADVAGIRFAGTAGETHTFSVATAQDEVVEHNETVTAGLSISGTSVSGLTTGTATGTITDDDSGTATTRKRKASEGHGLTFRVSLNRAVQGGVTVTPVFSDGTATSGTDYTPNESPLRFSGAAGEAHTFTVATTEDDDIEENETFTVGLRVSNAPAGVTAGDPVTGTIIDDDGPNEPPGFNVAGLTTTRAVAENTPAGGAVGDPVEATDPNGDVLSYTLSGSDAFAIDSGTGQIMVSEGTSLDYEAGPLSYAVTVTVNDGREGSDVIDVAISVTDVAEPPAAPAAPRVTGASLTSVQAVWRVPANTGPAVNDYDVRYRTQGASGWTAHAFTGTKTVAEIAELESEATYEVQVRAKNAEGAGAWSPSGSGRTRINTPPVAVDDAVTVFRGRRTTSLWTGDARHDARNPSFAPPEDFDIPEPDAGAKIAPLATGAAVSASDDGRISVLANDVDAEDDRSQLTAILVEAPAHGALTLYEDGTFVYNHDGSRTAQDRFTYRVLDSRGASSDEATVTIAIKGTNLGPSVTGTIPDQVLTMGTNGSVDLTGLFADPDGDPLEYEASSDNGIVNVSLVDRVIALTPVAVATARVTVTARDPYGLSAKLSFAVTVENLQTNRARVLELSLAAFGRTVLSQAVDAVAGRFEATSRVQQATLNGGRLVRGQAFDTMDWVHVTARMFGVPLDAPASGSPFEKTALIGLPGSMSDPNVVRPALRAPSGRGILTRSSFQMAMDRAGAAENGWTLWGRGAGSRYSGDPISDNRMDGSVTAAYVGADYHWSSKLVAGLAASYSSGVQDLDNAGESIGRWKTRLASLHPYVHWSPSEKLGLWGMLGFGTGDAELYSGYGGPLAGTGSSTVETDIDSRSAALGGRMDLTRVGRVDLALTADAFAVNTGSEAVAGLRAATGDARRVRMMVNGSTAWSVTTDTRMDLRLALGARFDGGDVETGLGTELAGALSLANRPIGLDVEIRSHWLAAHQDRDFREGGLSLALRLDPGADNRGLTLFIEPAWGQHAAGGVDGLWNGDRMTAYRHGTDGPEASDWRPNRARAGMGYGLETLGGRGRLAPFVEMDVADAGIQRLGGGLRLNGPGSANGSAGIMSRDLRLELRCEYGLPRQGFGMGGNGARVGLLLFRNF